MLVIIVVVMVVIMEIVKTGNIRQIALIRMIIMTMPIAPIMNEVMLIQTINIIPFQILGECIVQVITRAVMTLTMMKP